MRVKVLLHKTFEFVCEEESAKYLNCGDIFLPEGTGWDYKVIRKVCCKQGDDYEINVMVRPLSVGAKKYAIANQINQKL